MVLEVVAVVGLGVPPPPLQVDLEAGLPRGQGLLLFLPGRPNVGVGLGQRLHVLELSAGQRVVHRDAAAQGRLCPCGGCGCCWPLGGGGLIPAFTGAVVDGKGNGAAALEALPTARPPQGPLVRGQDGWHRSWGPGGGVGGWGLVKWIVEIRSVNLPKARRGRLLKGKGGKDQWRGPARAARRLDARGARQERERRVQRAARVGLVWLVGGLLVAFAPPAQLVDWKGEAWNKVMLLLLPPPSSPPTPPHSQSTSMPSPPPPRHPHRPSLFQESTQGTPPPGRPTTAPSPRCCLPWRGESVDASAEGTSR